VKVLVTGGAGFIGSHVVDALVSGGADVVCVDSLDPLIYRHAPDYLNPRADYSFVDLRHWVPDDRVEDAEVVVHLAALGGVGRAAHEPANVVGANVVGTARLVEAMSAWPSLRRVVLASSFSVYGSGYTYRCSACGDERRGNRDLDDLEQGRYEVTCARCGQVCEILPLDESGAPDPLELYGSSKLMQELCFRGFERCPVTVLRQSSVYGRRLRLDDGEATIIARIAGWIGSGRRPTLFEDGLQIRDWVHVHDVVAAVMALASGAPAPPVVNVCTGAPTRLIDACRAIAGVMGSTIEPEIVGGFRPGDMRHCLGDARRLTALIGRPPRSFAAGVADAFGVETGEPPLLVQEAVVG